VDVYIHSHIPLHGVVDNYFTNYLSLEREVLLEKLEGAGVLINPSLFQ
jgi:hypothetical protein